MLEKSGLQKNSFAGPLCVTGNTHVIRIDKRLDRIGDVFNFDI